MNYEIEDYILRLAAFRKLVTDNNQYLFVVEMNFPITVLRLRRMDEQRITGDLQGIECNFRTA